MSRFQFSMTDFQRIIIAEAHNGKTVQELIAYLQARGWPQEAAQHFVQNALHTDGMIGPKNAAEPAQTKSRPAWVPVLIWLSALSGLLWVLVDVAGRLPT